MAGRVHTVNGTSPTSYSMGIDGTCPAGKAARAHSWPHHQIWCPEFRTSAV